MFCVFLTNATGTAYKFLSLFGLARLVSERRASCFTLQRREFSRTGYRTRACFKIEDFRQIALLSQIDELPLSKDMTGTLLGPRLF
jgi:hypothetical protein